MYRILVILLACSCARAVSGGNGNGTGGNGTGGNGSGGNGSASDLGAALDLDAPGASDLAGATTPDLASTSLPDLGANGAPDLANPPDLASSGGIITGGPCSSGAAGATAIRVRWTNAGGTAQVQYEAFGMPDHARQKVSAYGNQIGFTPPFVDQPLGGGGLLLDGSDFVDVELSGAGISSITSATVAIYGRSYATGASGSFSWRSFTDSGETATNFVSNAAPYQWYRGDLGDAIAAGDANVLLRIKAGPSSGALAVSRLEICLIAH